MSKDRIIVSMLIVLIISISVALCIGTKEFYWYIGEGISSAISTTSTTYTSDASTSSQADTGTSVDEPRLSIVYVVLPLKNFTKLHNKVRADAVLVAPCYVEGVFDLPKVVPRKFKPSLYPSLRAVLLEPDIGDGYLGEEDYVIINLLIPEELSHDKASGCGDRESMYRMGFMYRYLVTLRPGLKMFTNRGIEILNTSITIAIYYTYSKPFITSGVPFDIQQTLFIGDTLGLGRPSEPLAVEIEYSSVEEIETISVEAWRKAEKASEVWSNWLNELYKKLRELELDRYVVILDNS